MSSFYRHRRLYFWTERDQIAAYTLTSSIVYKGTLTSINMIKFQ
jgi:hypothetical protein